MKQVRKGFLAAALLWLRRPVCSRVLLVAVIDAHVEAVSGILAPNVLAPAHVEVRVRVRVRLAARDDVRWIETTSSRATVADVADVTQGLALRRLIDAPLRLTVHHESFPVVPFFCLLLLLVRSFDRLPSLLQRWRSRELLLLVFFLSSSPSFLKNKYLIFDLAPRKGPESESESGRTRFERPTKDGARLGKGGVGIKAGTSVSGFQSLILQLFHLSSAK